MIRVAFQGNSIAARTGINGVEEIIIQTKQLEMQQFQLMKMEEFGYIMVNQIQSKEKVQDTMLVHQILLKGRVGKERLQGKLGILGTSATGLKRYKTNTS